MTPAPLDIVVQSRNVAFGGDGGLGDIVFLGWDWSDAVAIRLQVRAEPGDTAAPLLSLAKAPAGSAGISAIYDATLIDPDTGRTWGGTIFTLMVPATALRALPWDPAAPDAPAKLAFDLLVTPPGEPEQLFAFGRWTQFAGVTI